MASHRLRCALIRCRRPTDAPGGSIPQSIFVPIVAVAIAAQAYRLRLDADGDIEWVAQENKTEVVYRTEPHTSFWKRFQVGFLRLLPIEEQL
jgi:hypothetical protein